MNACLRPVRRIAQGACAVALLCAAAGAPAQSIYKGIDAAGGVIYTDQPDTIPTWYLATVPAQDVKNALAGNHAIASRRAAALDSDEATRRLGQALQERKQGAERLPGERADGTDPAGANHRYRARQEDLQREVEQAVQRATRTARLLRESP